MTTQRGLDFQPSNLRLTNRYYRKYEEISRILDDNPEIVSRAHRDLERALKHKAGKTHDGKRFQYSSEQVLRILLCQTLEGESLRGITVRIDDSHFLRRFARIDNGPMMDFTTLCDLKNDLRPETWKKLNQVLARDAVRAGRITGEKLRADTTAVETHIHWPTDSSLLWDTYRVLARLLQEARDLDPRAVGQGRLHPRVVKRLAARIGRKAARKRSSSKALKPLYRDLIGHVERICDWALSLSRDLERRQAAGSNALDAALYEMIAEELRTYVERGQRVIDQSRRRVLQGETVPNAEKIFSIFEAHTELLIRGKAGKEIEFGHMIQIQQVREKFITEYDVFEKRPYEAPLVEGILESHKELFGDYPHQFSGDKGYYESMESLRAIEEKVAVVSIAKKGGRTPEETARETDPLFRLGQRFRAGVEGTISFLKRVLGLFRCFNKTWDHYVATVGQTIFAHNLLVLARC